MKGAAALLLPLTLTQSASATYSITAVDTARREIGGAGASCVPYEVIQIYAAVPGQGAFNAQADFDDPAIAHAVELLTLGASAEDVLAEVTDPSLFPNAPRMQWGIVDATGGAARATGPEAGRYAGDLIGSADGGRFVFSVQGNLLTSDAVLEQARAGFESGGCDLADKLLAALEAAGQNGEGDRRCTPEGRAANSAYLDVTTSAGSRVRISVPDVSPDDPIGELRARYDAFRSADPCPTSGSADPPGGAPPAGGSESAADGCSLHRSHGTRAAIPGAIVLSAALGMRRRRRRTSTDAPARPGLAGGRGDLRRLGLVGRELFEARDRGDEQGDQPP